MIIKGSMLDNQYSGYGKAYNLDGTLQYDGEWKDGKYHGNGKSYYNGHLVFDGNWNNNDMCGYGIKHANPDKKNMIGHMKVNGKIINLMA